MIYKEEKDISLPRPHKYSCFWGKNHYLILRKCEKICLNPYPPLPRGGEWKNSNHYLNMLYFSSVVTNFYMPLLKPPGFNKSNLLLHLSINGDILRIFLYIF